MSSLSTEASGERPSLVGDGVMLPKSNIDEILSRTDRLAGVEIALPLAEDIGERGRGIISTLSEKPTLARLSGAYLALSVLVGDDCETSIASK